ncbi:hypothetical protein [Pelagerythrobacter marinus]|uniref:hypothetical protein n=1 Tax=Pelagerythrobacter marinus TaxID=538382 RepID=UPI002036731F|nr:hypothetical protein [Pelagerythrobacter marinus]USA39019.1 hypothetical protein NCF86_12010 [Pelagerythrobacter marinus]WPZ06896.1 hypothetical protein T8T98_16090 [Pelagerythrobacter marinus]
MIAARLRQPRGAFAAALARKAARLARARAETLLRARRDAASRWREPRLLWPLFAKD